MLTDWDGGSVRDSFPREDSMVRAWEGEGGGMGLVNNLSLSLPVGRPEKLPDVCYSWWVLASLKMIGKIHWISKVRTVELHSK